MPKVNCKADDYVYIKEDQHLIFFKDIYESNSWLLLLISFLELSFPGPTTFDVPISIEVKVDDNSMITINKNLEVSGSEDYRYFILKSHYEKWRKTYLISYCILVASIVSLSVLFLYGFIDSNLNYLMGVGFSVVALFSILSIVKLFNQFKKIKLYGIEDRKLYVKKE
ncbi:hypothetical protein [Clostridium tertium]|uniref:Uncharacterized protein n=1 Tax=Clostridium tertium TaxID=1559 RepID=A0A6N3DL26_9CLOT